MLDEHPAQRWMGYRLVAVDGTKVRLPLNDDLAEAFDTQGNQTQTQRPMALPVSQQDVLTRVPLSCELAPMRMGERFLAERLLSGLNTEDLALYDRGFPSFALFVAHRDAKVDFCVRLSKKFNTQVSRFIASGQTETVIHWTPTAKMRRDCARSSVRGCKQAAQGRENGLCEVKFPVRESDRSHEGFTALLRMTYSAFP
ncbi:Transposase DDE domain-containing protein [Ectothiorhodospira magna]|uniref:Transposase DDE domain-containing protein n=1 Tax=Ectothiorhodospira magna TaxID=867345 RepID=A0A1H9GCV7_9GAMM|nr:transposase [Ectothiorhodospira magna]SEQ47995.1 Transposase DDE domain-containing protein [Ectothiorhodospira magna]